MRERWGHGDIEITFFGDTRRARQSNDVRRNETSGKISKFSAMEAATVAEPDVGRTNVIVLYSVLQRSMAVNTTRESAPSKKKYLFFYGGVVKKSGPAVFVYSRYNFNLNRFGHRDGTSTFQQEFP
jgi:hypothetical protein